VSNDDKIVSDETEKTARTWPRAPGAGLRPPRRLTGGLRPQVRLGDLSVGPGVDGDTVTSNAAPKGFR
jgi:hypothetical protein